MKSIVLHVAAVAFVVFAVAGTPADEVTAPAIDKSARQLLKKDTRSCKKVHDNCSTSCADSQYNGFGVCREGRDGAETPMSIECCCCTEGFETRYWIGG